MRQGEEALQKCFWNIFDSIFETLSSAWLCEREMIFMMMIRRVSSASVCVIVTGIIPPLLCVHISQCRRSKNDFLSFSIFSHSTGECNQRRKEKERQ